MPLQYLFCTPLPPFAWALRQTASLSLRPQTGTVCVVFCCNSVMSTLYTIVYPAFSLIFINVFKLPTGHKHCFLERSHLLERERESLPVTGEVGAQWEGEGERTSQAGSTLSLEPDVGLHLMTP